MNVDPSRTSVPSVNSEKRNHAEKDAEGKGEREDETNNDVGVGHRRDEPVLPISAPTTPEVGNLRHSSSGWDWDKVHAFLCEDVDTDSATGPLSAFCFMTVSTFHCRFRYALETPRPDVWS
jgi:hypothetical protein